MSHLLLYMSSHNNRILAMLCIAFCIVFAPVSTAQGQGMSMHVTTGIVRVKMKSDTILPPSYPTSQMRASGVQIKPLSVGITKFDAVSQKYAITGAVRVFPYAGAYEEKHRRYDLHLWYDLTIDDSADPIAVAEELCVCAGVLEAEPLYRISQKEVESPPIHRQAVTTSDPDFLKQWGLMNNGTIKNTTAGVDIDLPDAWGITMGKSNVVVAIMDEGVDYTHQDLAANIWRSSGEIAGNGVDDDANGYVDDVYGYNFVTRTGNLVPGDHGTHSAGTIAAVNNNGIGISSIAGGTQGGQGTKIMSCQIFSGAGNAAAAPAFIYAADNGALISQNSWGYTIPNAYNNSDLDAIKYFIAEAGRDANGNPRPNTPMVGGIVIFSTGNNNDNSLWYPGAFDQVVSVASVGATGKRAYYSNYGSWVDITAPGGDSGNGMPTIYSTLVGNQYGYKQGTSMACPHVSGVAALVLAKYGSTHYTPDSLRVRLETGVTSLADLEPTYAQYMGSGLLNAYRSLLPFVSVTGINLPDTLTLYVGRTVTPTGVAIPTNATDQRIVWSDFDANLVAADGRGRLSGVAAGVTSIRATTYGGQFSKTCKVRVISIPLGNINILPGTLELSVNDNFQLNASFVPQDAAIQTVTWISDNPAVLTVDKNGLVTAVKAGTANVSATSTTGIVSSKCAITVRPLLSGISILPERIRVLVGEEDSLRVAIMPGDAINRGVTWESADPDIVSVDSLGRIKALQGGRYDEQPIVRITATSAQGLHTADAFVVVYKAPIAPEGFSPNGDGFNDYFKAVLTSSESYSLKIFDRSGQLCYESNDYKNDWDGTANMGRQKGGKIVEGTYFYILASNTSGTVVKGYTIVRY